VNGSDRRIRGLGEVSIRVNDLAAMCAFYEDVVGLKVLRREESYVFFEIAEGYRGHSQNLALFDAGERTFLQRKSEALSSNQSTLHHIALNIDLEDYESELTRLQGLGLDVQSTITVRRSTGTNPTASCSTSTANMAGSALRRWRSHSWRGLRELRRRPSDAAAACPSERECLLERDAATSIDRSGRPQRADAFPRGLSGRPLGSQ